MFNVGAVVEIPSSGNSVTLGIIWRMPIDFEFASKRLPKDKPEKPLTFHLDDSDDCYQVICLDDEFPDHIDVIDCFPPLPFQLDESYITRLKALSESFTHQVDNNLVECFISFALNRVINYVHNTEKDTEVNRKGR